MRKVILMLALAVVSSDAMAKWTLSNHSPDGNIAIYADIGSIHKTDNGVKIWAMLDYKKTQKTPSGKQQYMSVALQKEYDCKEQVMRIFTVKSYSKNMATGKVIETVSSKSALWKPVIPDTLEEDLMKMVCAKK